jgi:hypothetical protein
MRNGRNPRQAAVVTLLHSVRSRRALTRNAFVEEVMRGVNPAQAPKRRAELAASLPEIIEGLVDELGSESEQQHRRFNVLRRSDIARESHPAIARDIGLSRSQFYRDLHEARELLVEALEDRLSVRSSGGSRFGERDETRFLAIEVLRNGGQYHRACDVASVVARNGDAGDAIRALCLRAELETELGSFGHARRSAEEARTLLREIADGRLRSLLGAECDVVEFEAAHCQGAPVSRERRALLIERLRRCYGSRDREYAALLVKALTEEASILFERGDSARAVQSIEEASSIVSRERLADTRLAVDVKIRASGIHALQADRVSTALLETAEIVETGRRCGDIRTLRVGMQMMSAHLLTLGRFEEAKHYALESWTLIDLFGSMLDRVIVLSNLARVDIHRRDGHAALAWIRMAQGLSCDAFSITQALAISEAEALVLIDQAARAVEMTRALTARVRDWPRLEGRAKLAETVALSALGWERDARECSDQAVELSRGTGGPLLHLRALELNVKLTGNAGSRAALRDLEAALKT